MVLNAKRQTEHNCKNWLSKHLKMVNPVFLLRCEDGRENREKAGSPEDARSHHEVRPVVVPRVNLEEMLIVQTDSPSEVLSQASTLT